MLVERKVLGWMQLRPGPNRVGPWGLLQPAADAAKLILKEDLTPETADPLIYQLAPFISLLTAFAVYAVIPFGPPVSGHVGRSAIVNAGILFILAITSIGVYGISLGRLGLGFEVSAARQRALDRADDQLRACDVALAHRRADSGRNDLAQRYRSRAAALVVLRAAVRGLRHLHHYGGRRNQSRAVRSRGSGDGARRRASTPNTRGCASGCSSSPST